MGEMAKKIVSVDVDELLTLLNEAYGEEWLAYYQYLVGAYVAQGQMKSAVVEEFKEHAKEELEHADMLAERIIQLGGTPLLSPDEWEKHAKCKYEAPTKPHTPTLVAQNLASERCAVKRYKDLCDFCHGKDYETFRIAEHILKEELAHEQEMEDFLTDLDILNK